MTRRKIEALDHWVCTLRRTRTGVRDRYVCIIRDILGGFYTYTPNYKGMFDYGATGSIGDPVVFAGEISDGAMKVVKGKLPREIAQYVKKKKPKAASRRRG